MDFCCGGSSSYAPVETQKAGSGASTFPGQRRTYHEPPPLGNNGAGHPQFAPTGGNALQQFDPSIHAMQQKELVTVTIPPGVQPGQQLHVTAPDGSGRIVAATVPQGMQPGQSFQVEFPPMPTGPATATDSGNAAPVPGMPPSRPSPSKAPSQEQTVLMASVMNEPQQQAIPIAEPVPISIPAQQQQLMMVNVPPGTPAGTIVHVQIPNEPHRTIAAAVPPGGVTQFQVAYDAKPTQNAPYGDAGGAAGSRAMTQDPNGQRYIRVEVPPGTPPGTTLQVQVPGENRTVGAVVPPNVREFQVAYTPMYGNASVPPSQNAMSMSQQQQRNPHVVQGQPAGNSGMMHGNNQQYGRPLNNNANNNRPSNTNQWGGRNNNNTNNGGGGMAQYAPLVAAPLLMGAAAAGTYAMMSHNHGGGGGEYYNDGGNDGQGGGYEAEEQQDYDDDGGGYDDAGDDDFGGGDDF